MHHNLCIQDSTCPQAASAAADVQRSQTKLDCKQAVCAQLQTDLDSAQQRITALEPSLRAQLREALDQLKQQQESRDAGAAALAAKLELSQQQTAELQQMLQQQELELASAADLAAELDLSQKQTAELQQQLQQLQQQDTKQDSAAALAAELELSQQRTAELQVQLQQSQQLQDAQRDLATELDLSQQQTANLQAQLQTLLGKASEGNRQLCEAQRQLQVQHPGISQPWPNVRFTEHQLSISIGMAHAAGYTAFSVCACSAGTALLSALPSMAYRFDHSCMSIRPTLAKTANSLHKNVLQVAQEQLHEVVRHYKAKVAAGNQELASVRSQSVQLQTRLLNRRQEDAAELDRQAGQICTLTAQIQAAEVELCP